MTTLPVEFPDAVALVLDYLRDQLDDIVCVSQIPNPRPDTFLLVRRAGGVRLNVVADNPMLTVEAWAATPEAAHDLLAEARGRVHAMRGQAFDGVAVYRVTEIGGPAHLPDPTSEQPRYTMTVQVAVRGTAMTPAASS